MNEREKQQDHFRDVTKMVQEPVAWMVMMDGKEHFTAESGLIGHIKYDKETPLYTTPPTAALAARQMRDAAVKVCELTSVESYEDVRSVLAETIAALPVPSCASNASLEVQWREIMDDDVLEVMRKVSPATHPQLFARAVIAKFKEKNGA